jgi:hypothetical protein
MKVRFSRVLLYLTLALVPLTMVGCGESKDNLSVNPSPQTSASAPFPSPSVPATLNSPSKLALIRPTNPDDRLRVIKSGRPDPFGSVGPIGRVAPASTGGNVTSTASVPSGSTTIGTKRSSSGQESTPKRIATTGGSGTTSFSPNLPIGSISLPNLPKASEPAGVKVSGILVVGGEPRAIVQAPDEPTSRTVGIGDSLSGGKLFVKNIDISNRAEPKVLFQQGSIEFSVAVGREPVLLASVLAPNPPVRGLYSVQR